MRTMLDLTCPRCHNTTSVQGVTETIARTFFEAHVCPDGVTFNTGARITTRIVPGPGERLRDAEEKGR